MTVDNDTRGWILTCISGVACVLGALVICVDLLIRWLPGQASFRIQDSNAFLSSSLSLSAGVMLFSALYKMLPTSQSYLEKGGYSPSAAAWLLIACFLAGVWGIQLISRICHHFMPSHVVDCDHSHDDSDSPQKYEEPNGLSDHRHDSHAHANGQRDSNRLALETEPLLARSRSSDERLATQAPLQATTLRGAPSPLELGTWNRQSLQTRMTMKVTEIVSGAKASCDRDGPCYGYSNPCGVECFRNLNARGGVRAPVSLSSRPTLLRSSSTTVKNRQNTFAAADEEARLDMTNRARYPSISSAPTKQACFHAHDVSLAEPHDHEDDDDESCSSSLLDAPKLSTRPDLQRAETVPHHHHVPQNAFLSLSLQTSLAIALHKLPEGFITYATNHANPALGFTVFLALAIHNVTEGFALALPLYLATNSRTRAMIYSFGLGGLSQPLGAGVAALWLALAERGRGDYAPSEAVYGGMFAATAGIMANVALNLLQQSFELSHNNGLCMLFVFVGMGVLGASSALTAS